MNRLNISDQNFTYDSDAPDGYMAGMFGDGGRRRAAGARGGPHVGTPDGTDQLSDKTGVWSRERELDLIVRRSNGVGYFDGES